MRGTSLVQSQHPRRSRKDRTHLTSIHSLQSLTSAVLLLMKTEICPARCLVHCLSKPLPRAVGLLVLVASIEPCVPRPPIQVVSTTEAVKKYSTSVVLNCRLSTMVSTGGQYLPTFALLTTTQMQVHSPAFQSEYCHPFRKFSLGRSGSAFLPTAA